MSKAVYPVLNGTTHKGKRMYWIADGVTRKVKKAYTAAPNFPPRDLPSGYTQVEYIESSGTQYIDTGFTPNQDTRVVCKATVPVDSGTNWLFGARTTNVSNAFNFVASSSGYYIPGYNTTQLAFSTAVNSNDPILIDFNKQSITVTSNAATETKTGTYGAFTCPRTMLLFANNSNGTIGYGNVQVYACMIYDNGMLVRDYVPCINPSGAIGLYDMQNGVFYNNAGTGVFVAGPVYASIARLFYSGGSAKVSYTGTHTLSTITIDGVLHNLMTITKAGTLTVEGDVVKLWMCGGGGGGRKSYTSSNIHYPGTGGGGGSVNSVDALEPGSYTLAIGAAGSSNGNGGTTSVKNTATSATVASAGGGKYTGTGGSGGGGVTGRNPSGDAYSSTGYKSVGGGIGEAKSTIPFGVSTLKKHSAGGSGGSCGVYGDDGDGFFDTYFYRGGTGGSNGANGGNSNAWVNGSAAGGSVGGGVGGYFSDSGVNYLHQAATDATFYGSGGGGGALYTYERTGSSATGTTYYDGGKGYQGVIYVAWPAA